MSRQKSIKKAEELQMMLTQLVQAANETCAFSQRNTELNAERFVQTLVIGWLRQGDASLNELAQMAQELGIDVTGSAIHERINTASVELLGRVLVSALRCQAKYPQVSIENLSQFSAIYVTDSTQISLPQSLINEFVGCNQSAMLKLQVTLDYLRGQWVALEMVNGKEPDQNCDLVRQQALAGSLNLFDLGYFKQERLRDIDAQDAYFVSRYQSQTALYDPDTGQRLLLHESLQSMIGDEVDCWVQLGGRVKLAVRLVARRLPPDHASARRRKAKLHAKDKGKTYSKIYLSLLDWDILITNLPQSDWLLSQIFDLYPIRTQIEWLFRIWKSQLNVDHFGNWRSDRVLTQLYAHLIGALLCQHFTAGWLWRNGQEYSLFKCVQIIRSRTRDLMICIARNWWGIKTWYHTLEDAFQQFGRKTKRKKTPSTCQILVNLGLS